MSRPLDLGEHFADHVGVSDSPSVAELLEWLAARDAVIAEQAAVIEALRGQLAVAQAEIAELKRRLGLNSSNSSLPPSLDGPVKPAPKSLRGRTGKKSGGQTGHPGRTLSQVDTPDKTIVHAPVACEGCGSGLGDAPAVGVARRQVFEVPEPNVTVTEHQIVSRRCGCGAVTAGQAPAGVQAPVQYGPRAQALIVYLVVGQFLAQQRAAEAMDDLFGLPVCDGTVAAVIACHAGRLDGFIDLVKTRLREAEVVNADETGLRVAGRTHWVHSTSTDKFSLISVHRRRGREGIDAHGVLNGYTGVIVHDAWRPYDCYRDAAHALCNSHLLRELQQVIDVCDEPGRAWAEQARHALLELNTLAAAAAETGRDVDPVRLAQLRSWYTSAAATGITANDHRSTKIAQRHHALARRMFDRVDDYLRFATDLRVPFTNNAAEREVRMVKLRQKISSCMRTLTGARHFTRIRSYLATARKHGITILDALNRLAQDQPWLPAAS